MLVKTSFFVVMGDHAGWLPNSGFSSQVTPNIPLYFPHIIPFFFSPRRLKATCGTIEVAWKTSPDRSIAVQAVFHVIPLGGQKQLHCN